MMIGCVSVLALVCLVCLWVPAKARRRLWLLQAVVSYLTWVLGTELQFSERAARWRIKFELWLEKWVAKCWAKCLCSSLRVLLPQDAGAKVGSHRV